jgi:hypothetical protein
MHAPDLSRLVHDEMLVLRAVQYWRLSGSSIMPRYEDMQWRDEAWDTDVYMMRQNIEYYEDAKLRERFGL